MATLTKAMYRLKDTPIKIPMISFTKKKNLKFHTEYIGPKSPKQSITKIEMLEIHKTVTNLQLYGIALVTKQNVTARVEA